MQMKWLLVSVLTVPLVVPAVGAEASSTPGAEDASGPSAPVVEGASNSDATSEVIITATKRESTVQSTPISISAVSGDDLQARGTASLAALAQGTPGVSLKREGPSQTGIEMGGMTSGGGNSRTVGVLL